MTFVSLFMRYEVWKLEHSAGKEYQTKGMNEHQLLKTRKIFFVGGGTSIAFVFVYFYTYLYFSLPQNANKFLPACASSQHFDTVILCPSVSRFSH